MCYVSINMAVKRRKKTVATEVSAAPNEADAARAEPAATHGDVSAASGKGKKVETTRGEVAAKSDIRNAPSSEAAVALLPPGKTAARSDETGAPPDREQQIREHAYHIWKRDGEPDGRHEEHWTLAERVLQGKL